MSSGSATKAVLIHFAGPDAHGLTARLTRILANYNITILDIGQAVVHESLVLGILVEVPAGRESGVLRSAVKSALVIEAHALGLQAHFTAISEDRVKRWEHSLHHHHFIITILGRVITAEQLARVTAIIAAHGMNVDRIDRLSGELAPVAEHANACIELAVRGDPSREPAMRTEFLAVASNSPSISPSSARASSAATAVSSPSTWTQR